MLTEGISKELSKVVQPSDSARSYGSGMVDVLATPAMIGFMEQTCLELVLPFLEQGFNTVGTAVNIKHLKATQVGKNITCKAVLVKIEGKKLLFSVQVFDHEGLAGEGEHERFIIDVQRFMDKLNQQTQ